MSRTTKKRGRKKSNLPKQLDDLGRQFYVVLLQSIVITMVSTLVYMIFFPTIIPFLLDLTGIEGSLPVFPDLTEWVDYYGLYASLIFFIVHLSIIRIFIHDNKTLFVGLISGTSAMGLHLVFNQVIFGLLAFAYGSSYATETGWFSEFNIQTLNLFGLIILYDVIFILLILILLRRPNKKNE